MTGDDMKDEGRVLNLDKPRTFKVTWNTMRALQKKYGTVESAFEKVSVSDYDAILYLLWAAQVGDDPLDIDALGAVISPQTFAEAFSTAFEMSGAPQKKKSLLSRALHPNAKRPRR